MASKITEPCSSRIKTALSVRNMTQAELCAKAKISKSTLSEYISGKYEPSNEKIYFLSQALNVNPAWLMGVDVPMEIEDIKKDSPDKVELTEEDLELLQVFKLIPEELRRAYLEQGRVFANSLKKD